MSEAGALWDLDPSIRRPHAQDKSKHHRMSRRFFDDSYQGPETNIHVVCNHAYDSSRSYSLVEAPAVGTGHPDDDFDVKLYEDVTCRSCVLRCIECRRGVREAFVSCLGGGLPMWRRHV